MTPQQEGLQVKARRNLRSARVLLADGDYDAAEFHAHLREAAEARNISDYQVVSYLTEEATVQHISRAEELLTVAEHILKA